MKKSIFIFSVLTFSILVSCKKEVKGCKDSTATNYNSKAMEDDGSCKYKSISLPSELNFTLVTMDIPSINYNLGVEIFINDISLGTPPISNTISPCDNNSLLNKTLNVNTNYNIKVRDASNGDLLAEYVYRIEIMEDEYGLDYVVNKELLYNSNVVNMDYASQECSGSSIEKWFLEVFI